MNAIANNIISGPWKNERILPDPAAPCINPLENVKKLQATHITQTLLTVIPMLFNDIHIAGFSLDNTTAEGTFIMESVKALLCKHYGIYHPFQDIAEKAFIIRSEDDIEFATRIELDLKPIENIDVEIDMEEDDDLDALDE